MNTVVIPSSGATVSPDGITVSWLATGVYFVSNKVEITSACGSITTTKQDSATNTVYVVGVQPPLQYRIGTNAWANMPDPLVVAKDTPVDFLAIKTPTNVPSWPSGKPVWSGATGSGDQAVKTFDTVSASTTDYKIVTAECGNTVSGRVIVLKVDIEELDFQDSAGDNNYDCRKPDGTLLVPDSYEIKVDVPANEPAVYSRGANPRVRLKLRATPAVTTSISGLLYSEGDLSFGSMTAAIPLAFTSGDATVVLDTTNTVASDIRVRNYAINWRGCCEDLDLSSRIYTVYAAPKCANDLYTTNNLNTCVGWADGCNKVDTSNDATNIPHQVQHGVKGWYGAYGYTNTGIKPDPFTWIPANKGDCITYADLMTKGLLVLGVDATSEYITCVDAGGSRHWYYSPGRTPYWRTDDGDADGDGTKNRDEAGWPGTLEGIYVWGFDPAYNAAWRTANAPWNFHGASSCAGHWWEITFFSTPDHDTEANMKAFPNGPVIDYPGHLYPGNDW